VRIETDDDLAFDNQRFVGLLCAPPVSVLLVDGDPRDTPQLAETYFLQMALRLAPPGETFADSPYRTVPVPLGAGDRLPALAQHQIVVLANVGNLSRGDAQAISRFVEGGGSLLVFTGDRVEAAGYREAASAGLTVGEIGQVARAHDLPFRLERWDEEHPIFEMFNDPQHGDLRRFAFSACTRIIPAGDARAVAWFRGGNAALIEKKLGKGRIAWFAATCDRDWGDWTRSRLYLPFMHQVLGYLAGLTGGGPVRDVLIDAVAARGAAATPGIFEREGFTEVVNPSPRESEIDRCTPDEFANRFQLVLGDQEVAEAGRPLAASLALTGDLRDDEVWYWVVFILLGILLLEGFVANRTAA
jgi:hypothetical protein